MRYFPENVFLYRELFDLACPMIIHPHLIWGFTLLKIGFSSPWHLEEMLCDFHYHVLLQEKNVTWSRY